MTIMSGYGLALLQILDRATDGTPASTSATVYSGLRTSGLTFALTFPDHEDVVFNGDDRPMGRLIIPPTGLVTGEITAEQQSFELMALFSGGLTTETVGASSEASWILGPGNNLEGQENPVIIVANQQAIDTEAGSATLGNSYYKWAVVLNAKVTPKPAGFENGTKSTETYMVWPNTASKIFTGQSLSASVSGATSGVVVFGKSSYKIRVVAATGDGATTAFTFETGFPAAVANATHISVYKNGTEVVAGLTLATTSVTFSVAPASNDKVVIVYQTTGA